MRMDDWKIVVRIGGGSAVLSGALLILAVQKFSDNRVLLTDTREELLVWLGRNRTEFVTAYSLVLTSVLLMVPLLFALYRVLREKSPAFALLGAISGLISSAVFALFVSLLVGTSLYMADTFASTPLADRRLVLLVADAIGERGLLIGLVPLALVFAAAGFFLLGMAILGGTPFPKWSGWLSIILSVAMVAQVSLPSYLLTIVTTLLLFVWNILLGVKVLRVPIR